MTVNVSIYQMIGRMNECEQKAYKIVLQCLACEKFNDCQSGKVVVEQPRSLLELFPDEISPDRVRVA